MKAAAVFRLALFFSAALSFFSSAEKSFCEIFPQSSQIVEFRFDKYKMFLGNCSVGVIRANSSEGRISLTS